MTVASFRRGCRRRTLAPERFREVCTGFGTTSRSFRGRDRRSGETFEGFGTAFEGGRNASIGQRISAWTVATTSFALDSARPGGLFRMRASRGARM